MVQVGSGLLSYGPNRLDLSIQFAAYIDKVLKGAAPADLPIEQPRSFELFLVITSYSIHYTKLYEVVPSFKIVCLKG